MTETTSPPTGHRPHPVRLVGTLVMLAVGIAVVYQIAVWPDVEALADEPPSTTAFIERYRETQRARGEPGDPSWRWVSWDAISPNLKKAILVSEDIEFFRHNGFSTPEMREAIREAWEERTAPRGASTLTQQVAKNLWLSPSRNPFRKLKEAILTLQLERALSKRRIFELYLNVAEFGPGVYGAEAAARRYFGRSARDLAPAEGALLAASLPRPRSWNPSSTSTSYRRRAGRIQDLMDHHRDYLDRTLRRAGAS